MPALRPQLALAHDRELALPLRTEGGCQTGRRWGGAAMGPRKPDAFLEAWQRDPGQAHKLDSQDHSSQAR